MRKQLKQCSSIKKQIHHLAYRGPYNQSYGFSSSYVQMWDLHHKEGWALKNWCLWIVVLEKTLGSPLDTKEIQPVHTKGNQSWIIIGRTDSEPDVKNWLIEKDSEYWERLRTQGDDRRWDGWMASLTQWTRVWASSGKWWRTGKPGVLQSMGVTKSQIPLSDWTKNSSNQVKGIAAFTSQGSSSRT